MSTFKKNGKYHLGIQNKNKLVECGNNNSQY